MEQQTQKLIQESTGSKFPIKSHRKYITIAILVALGIGVGVFVYFTTQQTPILHPDQIQRTPLVKVYTHGGLCPTGECRSEIVINLDGTFVYIPDLNTKGVESTRIEGSVSVEKLSFLKQAIEQSNFPKLKEKKFTELCPTAYDGFEGVYTFYVGNTTEEIASCTVAIDRKTNPFRTLDDIVSNEIISQESKGNVLDTSTWQTYHNEEFGFEMRYPSDWKVTGLAISTQFAMNAYCQSVKKIDEQPPPDSGSAWVFHSSVQICAKAREDTLSLAEFMQQEYGDRLESWFETAEINGMLVYRSGGDRSADATLFLQSGNYRIQLISAVVAESGHQEERVSQVNQILSTFRFIESQSGEGAMSVNQDSGIIIHVFCTRKIYDTPCSVGGVVVKTEGGVEATRQTPDNEGMIQIPLTPGNYTIVSMPGSSEYPVINTEPKQVKVQEQKFTEVNIYYWDGRR